MRTMIADSILDTLKDTVLLVPILFLAYLAMEWLEHRTEERSIGFLSRIGRLGPLAGGALGIVPQCGFSAAASSLYSGGVITMGTLLAVFLSTSDEMLPIFISSGVAAGTIGRILLVKFLIAVVTGFALDGIHRLLHHRLSTKHIHDLCAQDHCGCEEEGGSMLRSALIHTIRITIFIFVISLAISLLIGLAGEQTVAGLLTGAPVIGILIAGLIGLIPNCAASVVIAQLYLEGLLTSGQMICGLLTGAGAGLIVLVRANRRPLENLQFIAVLYICGVIWGFVIDTLGISF